MPVSDTEKHTSKARWAAGFRCVCGGGGVLLKLLRAFSRKRGELKHEGVEMGTGRECSVQSALCTKLKRKIIPSWQSARELKYLF